MSGLEALAAASATLQTISFAHEAFTLCYDFYDDKPVAFDKLSRFAMEMQKATDSIRQHITELQSPSAGADDQNLIDILQRTSQNATELHGEVAYVLEKRRAGRLSRAFRTHFRYMKKKSTIATLKSSLDDCDRAAKAMIANRNLKQSDAILFQQSRGFTDLSYQIQSLMQELMDQKKGAEKAAQDSHRTLRDDVAGLSEKLAQQAEAEGLSKAHQQLVESLEFPEMWQRQNQIVDSGEASFEGVFRAQLGSDDGSLESSGIGWESQDAEARETMETRQKRALLKLRTWFDTGTTPFWISGHPGSGKSTLVKFLADQERKHSKQQPELKKEVLAHFLWRAGSDMQQSDKGCFCSLIHQLLQNCPQRSERLCKESHNLPQKKHILDWSLSELQNTFHKLIAESSTVVIVFLDGLDEMTADGDLFHLLEILRWQDQLLNCRFCISSRPEIILEKHLSGYPTIYVQELTYGSMRIYATNKLSHIIDRRGWEHQDKQELLSSVVRKAEGIFLWLVLVTDILRRCMLQGKDYYAVLQRLNGLPTKLEALFTDMWDRMGADFAGDKKLAASYINAVVTYEELADKAHVDSECKRPVQATPSLINILFMVDPEGAERLFGDERSPRRADQIDWLETRREQLITCSVGLLMCYTAEHSKDLETRPGILSKQFVLFVHRSAYDFFTTTEAGQMICSSSKSTHLDLFMSLGKAASLELSFLQSDLDPLQMQHAYRSVITAVTGLSEAVESDYSLFTRATDLLYDLCDKSCGLGSDFDRYFVCMAGRKHVLDMLAAPSIAPTEVGSCVLYRYWKGQTAYMHQRSPFTSPLPVTSPPTQIFVAKMLDGGANPHEASLSKIDRASDATGNSPFNAFLMYVWCWLFNSLYDFPHFNKSKGLHRLEPPVGCWAALNRFLKANPRLTETVRLPIWVNKSQCILSLGDPLISKAKVRIIGADISDYFDESIGMAVFSADSGLLCRLSLAICRKLKEIGLIREHDPLFLSENDRLLHELEEKQGYQRTDWTLAQLFQYDRDENAFFWRNQFDELSAACAADFFLKRFEQGLGERQWKDHDQTFRALLLLMWVDDFRSYVFVKDGKPSFVDLGGPRRSDNVNRVTFEHKDEWSTVPELGLNIYLYGNGSDARILHVSTPYTNDFFL